MSYHAASFARRPAVPPSALRLFLIAATATLVPGSPAAARPADAPCPPAAAATSRPNVIPEYQRHVFFDHSLSPDGYFFGTTELIWPSVLAQSEGKVPVSQERYTSPPNSLKLSWTSNTGGLWRVNLHPRNYLNLARFLVYEGDVLQMRLWAERDVPGAALPFLGLEDVQELVYRVRLDHYLDGLPGGHWTTLRIPLAVFHVETADGRVLDPRQPARIFLEQWLDDGEPHTVYIDDIRYVPAEPPNHPPPPEPKGLSARGFERHVELAWTPPETAPFSYVIERSVEDEAFESIGVQQPVLHRYVDWLGKPDRTASYRVRACDVADHCSAPSRSARATTRAMSDEELLTMVQEATFRYYWDG
ncbi:MAG TPA: hypothetical protein VE175_03620, partial [Woeseiaceae bacterium]|nr:hypothetical protein [Woeseiaceae bacterium]